ncbi:MAG: transcription antitermination factor NusB [Angelakisella sp.]|jgi:N utilization substance protein B|nr:transcription antitermination factor NusB [Angelakisella sp.]MCI9667223.1 transcription antitermination factor NusB [Angelakisella sp.]
MAQTTRRESREQAFALVFEMIFNDAPVEELVEGAAQCRDISIGDYALEAAKAVRTHWEELDGIIRRFSAKWKLERLPKVTLSVLRLAICEIAFLGTPTGAVIDEAVELTKKYGGDDDPAYVNGVLGGYARSLAAAPKGEETDLG